MANNISSEEAFKALAYMADWENWEGNPHSYEAILLGHFTPYELACGVLGVEEGPTKLKEANRGRLG